jgi:integrase
MAGLVDMNGRSAISCKVGEESREKWQRWQPRFCNLHIRNMCRAFESHSLRQHLSSEFEERKRGWKRCDCPIVVSGTLQKKFKRVSTRQWEWAPARIVAAKRETAGTWDEDISAPRPIPTVQTAEEQITIERACKAFLAEREETLSANTYRKNDYVLNSVRNYAASKGCVLLAQWAPIDVRELRTSWGVAPNTAAKYMEIVKSFFSFAVANKWNVESTAKLIKGPKGKAANNQRERIPFSDEELQRMYDACEHQYGKTPIRWSRDVHHRQARNEFANYRYKWTGEDLADFISVSTYTGLRISDVATFHIDRLQKNGECHVRTTKTGRKVHTWIPEWLQERIRARVIKHGPFILVRTKQRISTSSRIFGATSSIDYGTSADPGNQSRIHTASATPLRVSFCKSPASQSGMLPSF